MGHPIGTRVVILRSDNPLYVGIVTTVISKPFKVLWSEETLRKDARAANGEIVQDVSIPSSDGVPIAYPPRDLEPLPDDSHEKSTWSSLPEWARRVFGRKEIA
jgi:hypothetical protein